MPNESRRTLLFLNRSYWPDAEATGQLLTELCEQLSDEFDSTVLAGQPNQNPRREAYRASGREVRNGVTIERVRHTQFGKRSLFGKALNFLTFLWCAFWRSLRMRRRDVVVCETDPFLLPLLAMWIRFRTRCKLVFYLQDLYPDIAVAVGKAREGLLTGAIRRVLRWCYRRADRILVLSEDMRAQLVSWGSIDPARIEIVSNWVDTRAVVPLKTENPWRGEQNPDGDFLVVYSGNLGLSQDLHLILDTADLLRDEPKLRFLLIGDGALRGELERSARERQLGNVRFLPYQPRERLTETLSAADLHLIPIRGEALRCLMPSKLYGILASGTPVLSTAPAETELARLVVGEQIGYNQDPFRPPEMAALIRQIRKNPQGAAECGRRGRALAEARFDRTVCIDRIRSILRELNDGNNPPGFSSGSIRTAVGTADQRGGMPLIQ